MFAEFAKTIRTIALSVGGGALLAGCATNDALDAPAASTPALSAESIGPATQANWLTKCEKWDDWDKPGPAFPVHGNTYYVGTCGIAAILITGGEEGHILIDSGTDAGADVVLANIRALGFDPRDIGILLLSHEHFDHAGGMAKLQAATGARVYASPDAVTVLASGEDHPEDPQFGMHDPMEPVVVSGEINHGDYVSLGKLDISAIATPGHTPGAMSWQWESCADETDDATCLTIVYADSLSPVSADGYRFSDHPEYLEAYREGLDALAKTPCEILTTPHPSSSQMVERMAMETGLQDRTACVRYAAHINARIDKRLAEEAAAVAE